METAAAMTSTFFGEFFKSTPKPLPPLQRVSRRCGDDIWGYLTLKDVLNLSVASRACLGLKLSVENINRFLEQNPRITTCGRFKISFGNDVTFGMFRSMLYRVMTSTEAVLTIDGSTGRVLLDIGSAFATQESFLSAMATAVPVDNEDDQMPNVIDQPILKAFERASFDEYDDYHPLHPMMRSKGHRRGGSYFNSDVEEVAREAIRQQNFDLSSMAALAVNSLTLEGEDSDKANKLKSISEKARALRAKASQ
jgi:hypothetical protein